MRTIFLCILMLFIASTQTWAQNHVENDSRMLQDTAPRKGEKAMLRGDVNGDGTVTITDVTELVNIILGKNTEAVEVNIATDVNRDHKITIADVTALVNIILGHSLPELPFDPDDGTGEALAKPN